VQIDWLTVAAQIVNFLVLVWLLQRFLYKPITRAMRRREERIEERLAEAREAREEAEEEARRLKEKQAELEDSKDEILASARDEAESLRARLEDDIREEMEEKRETWRGHLAEERDAFVASLRRQAGQQLLRITERVLAEYGDTDIAERVVATFAGRLKSLDEETREKLAEAAGQEGATAVVETGSAVDSEGRRKVTRAIHEILSRDVEVDYREDPQLVMGVRLTIGDYTAEWSAERYLRRLETELGEIIDAGTQSPRRGRETAEEAEKAEPGKNGDRETA